MSSGLRRAGLPECSSGLREPWSPAPPARRRDRGEYIVGLLGRQGDERRARARHNALPAVVTELRGLAGQVPVLTVNQPEELVALHPAELLVVGVDGELLIQRKVGKIRSERLPGVDVCGLAF